MRKLRPQVQKLANRLVGKGSTRGFSLTEVLAATIILTLVSAMVAGGVSFAVRQYHESMFNSRSAILASSIQNSLASSVRFMRPQKDGDASSTNPYVMEYQGASATAASSDGCFWLVSNADGQVYLSKDGTAADYKLLNSGAYDPNGMRYQVQFASDKDGNGPQPAVALKPDSDDVITIYLHITDRMGHSKTFQLTYLVTSASPVTSTQS